MTGQVVYAEHRSWRCWLEVDRLEKWVVLEVVWQISGMVPRVLLRAGQGERRLHPASQALGPDDMTISGPSGHTYSTELPDGLVEIAASALETWSSRPNEAGLPLLQIGVDIDTSQMIFRRAFDLLLSLVDLPIPIDDKNTLQRLLVERSSVWDSW